MCLSGLASNPLFSDGEYWQRRSAGSCEPSPLAAIAASIGLMHLGINFVRDLLNRAIAEDEVQAVVVGASKTTCICHAAVPAGRE